MCKKFICLISFVMVLGMTGNALADTAHWRGTSDQDWGNADNWWMEGADSTGVPTSADEVKIYSPFGEPPSDPVISGIAAVGSNIAVGSVEPEAGNVLTMNSGTLTTNDWLILGYLPGSDGTLDMNGGDVTLGTHLYAGFYGNGTLNMTGGTIDAAMALMVGGLAGSTGHLQLDGGTIQALYLAMNGVNGAAGSGTIDITGGTLELEAYRVPELEPLIADGSLTAYGGAGSFVFDWDPDWGTYGLTTVTAVPEPATMMLLGLGGLLIRRRRA